MIQKDADEIVEMVAEHWNMYLSSSTRFLWTSFLLGQDAALATKAVAYLAARQPKAPKVSDLQEVIAMVSAKDSRALPKGVCPTCADDRFVLISLRENRTSQWMREHDLEASGVAEEYAPCPDCNPSADTSFTRIDGVRVSSPDPSFVRERIKR